MRSEVLHKHLLSLDGTAVPDAFMDVRIEPGQKVNIARGKVLDAVNIICAPAVFDAYADEYMQRADIFTSTTFKNSLSRFVDILRDVLDKAHGDPDYDGSDDASITEPARYTRPAFTPRSELAGTNLTQKSTFSEKMHAIDLIIDNPDMLIAYAALDAMLCDYFSEGHAAWDAEELWKHHPSNGFVKARNAFATLDHITNKTQVPALGMVHGLLTQTYFRHLCNCVQDNRPAGQWQKRDVAESIAALYPSHMFTGEKVADDQQPAVCPMQRTYFIAALGFAHRQRANGDARLWALMQNAHTQDEPREFVREKLGNYFRNTLRMIIQEQPFARPTPQPN